MAAVIDFVKIEKYFADAIKAKADSLRASGIVQRDYSIKDFADSGEYYGYRKKEYTDQKAPENEIVLCAIDGGTIQDTSSPIETYMKLARIVFFAREEYREDIRNILCSLQIDQRSLVDSIDSTAVQISVESTPSFSSIQNIGLELFTGSYDADVIVFGGAHISNSYSFGIDGTEVPITAMSIRRAFQVVPNLPKQNTVGYIENTSALDIAVEGIYTDNAGIREMYAAALDVNTLPASFTVAYQLRGGSTTDVPFSQKCYLKEVQFVWAFGKLVTWKASFTLASSVGLRSQQQ
jgi:hypothetical protein